MRQKASLQSINRRCPSANVTPNADWANRVLYHSEASNPAGCATPAKAAIDRSRVNDNSTSLQADRSREGSQRLLAHPDARARSPDEPTPGHRDVPSHP
jgi:hypothetical protein